VLDPKLVAKAQNDILPLKVAAYLADAQPPSPMFNSYNWGGYFMFALPDEKVFVDGRTDLYGDDFLTNAYLKTARGEPGWNETLDQYGINTVVVEANSGLARSLRSTAGWSLDYEDAMAVVFTREGVNE
jgi:hypothetical protein